MMAILTLSSFVDKDNERFHNLVHRAEVVEWQTRTFEGRVGKPMRVQVPPSAPITLPNYQSSLIRSALTEICGGLEPGF
jgi:hypothetical protein